MIVIIIMIVVAIFELVFRSPSSCSACMLSTCTHHPTQPNILSIYINNNPDSLPQPPIHAKQNNDPVGYVSAVGASIFSAFFINPIRMIEKQQRAYFKTSGTEKPIMEILRESAAKNYRPLFRGTVPLMGHSLASATTGLVGQPQLQKYIQKELSQKGTFGQFTTGLISSAIVSPIYIIMTNPLSRLEVIMQTSSIQGKSINLIEALKEMATDSKKFGLRGVFRGQGIGIAKAIISLTMFHQGRIFLTDTFKDRNERLGRIPKE